MNPRIPFTVTITITEQHLARGVAGCAAECPIAIALGEHDELSSEPGLEVIAGGRAIDLYRDNEHVFVASVGPLTRDWMICYDAGVEVETPFTTTLRFMPWLPAELPVGHPEG